MHRLVPNLILENLSKGILQGQFPCTGLFVDVSGFTKVTEELMGHGQHGAEVMATIMRTIFTLPVHSVFAQGGFVTNFAGDAFTAVFPFSPDWPDHPAMRALSAAQEIQRHMAANALQITRYGAFEFSAKVGIAGREAAWGILQEDAGERAAYYFKGSAITGPAGAEHHATAGEIIAGPDIYETICLHVQAQQVSDHWQITRITTTLPAPQPVKQPPADEELMARFFPRSLLEQEINGEFRQVISLFINLQGTPDHIELNDFAVKLFNLEEKYGGVLNRIDFADKGCHMLLFWGAPTSYENDISRALHFILDLSATRAIPLRAGITYRIAHAGPIGSDLAEEYTCYGRGVNLAARHMTTAGWGEIWLDGQIARRAKEAFNVKPLGSVQFKGFADPQPVFLLTGRREDEPSIFGDRLLVGRTEELRLLSKAVQPVFAGQFGGVVAIVGEAGIGKTRLVHEFLNSIVESGEAAVFLCQTDEIIRQSLNPFRYFLRHYFKQSTSLNETQNRESFEKKLENLLQIVPDVDLRDELARTSSFLGILVGLSWQDSLYETLTPELRFENTLAAIKTLLRAESLCHPVILQLEDAHWLDDDSRGFLERLTRNMAGFPVALVVTSRTEVAGDLFAPGTPLQVIELQTLGDTSLIDLARDLLGREPSPSLLQIVGERTQGNPFFIEQMLLYLQENDLIEKIEAQAGAVLPADVVIPTDVQALLTARLDRLPAPVKDVVQKAAVLGREFETPILLEMVAGDPELESKLGTAEAENIWFALEQTRYLFRHALLRDEAYDMQLHSRLRRLHKLAAEAFEHRYEKTPDQEPPYAEIAYHFDKAEETDPARSYYSLAGEQAKDSYHNQEAITYFGRALDLTDEANYQSRYNYYCGRETIFQWLGKRDDQQNDLQALENLLQSHPDNLKLSDLALRQSSYALVLGDYGSAITKAQHALQFAKNLDDTTAQAKAYHRWGRTLWQQGQNKEAEGYLSKALALAQTGRSRDLEADCLYDLGMVFKNLAQYEEAHTVLDQASIFYEKLNDEQGLVRCENLFGVIDYERGDLIGSHQHYLQALAFCRNIGWRFAETYILINIGNNYLDLGDFENAHIYLNQALGLAKETGDGPAEAVCMDSLGLISYGENKCTAAVDYFQQALEVYESVSNQRSKSYVLTHLGHTLALMGDNIEAESILGEALKIRSDLQEEALIMDTLSGLALDKFLQGHQNHALSYVHNILSWIKEHGSEGLEYPVQVYLICYQILDAAAKVDHHLHAIADTVLEDGHALLMARLERINDEGLQKLYMEKVPYNRKLHAAWLKSHE